MNLVNPEWLMLVPVILLAGWWLPRLRLFQPLRIALLILAALTLARPQWRRLADGIDLWVLLDNSVSAERPMSQGLPEWQKLLEKNRGRNDRIFYLNYAGEVMRRDAEGAELYARNQLQTRTGLAITEALAFAQREGKGRPARVLAFTDGYATEALTGIAEKLTRQQVELDYRIVRDPVVADFRVAAMKMPVRAQLGEPFLIEIEVRGSSDAKVPLTLMRNGAELKAADVDLHLGSGIVRFTDRVTTSGVAHYEAVIRPLQDAFPGNNRHEAMIEVSGGPRVLLLTSYQDDPVALALQRQGFTVETVTDLRSLRSGQVAGARCVIFNNVPAFELPADFLPALDFYVREQGGSLMMIGGRHSFAAGGYFESPIDPLLPVSMELKQEHRKLMVAMSIVMDRSGSMGMTVPSGFTKMSLADEGAGNAIRFLGSQDLLSVFAVDSEPHPIIPLQEVGPNRDKMESAVRRIESTGGGIFVYRGLEAGWNELKTATAGQRHIILFSDAADSEEPGDYRKLLEDVTGNGGTVSVIALGTRADSDAALLDDIAKRGNGRIFFTDKAEELPSLFSQETVAVARSAFIKEPVDAQPAGGWFEISGQSFEWLPKVDAYNLSYLRDWASQGLVSKDEYTAPLVAFGQRGIGRTAAVSFPLGGAHSELVRAWPKYGDFLQTLVRWLMGEQLPPGIGLRHRLDGNTLTLDLLYDESWESRLTLKAPRIRIAHGQRADSQHEVAWERLAPGHYRASTLLADGDLVRGAIQIGTQALTFGPIVAGANAEWAFDEGRTEELRRVSEASGGRELLDLSQAWRTPPVQRFMDLGGWLLPLVLLLMLADALVTRTGWKLPEGTLRSLLQPSPRGKADHRSHDHQARLRRVQTAQGQPSDDLPERNASAPPPAQQEPDTAAKRQSRFARAKKN